MKQPEQTGDLTSDLGHAVAYFPIFLVQWALGLILVIISDYAIFSFAVTGVVVGSATTRKTGLAAFLGFYSLFRVVNEHAGALHTGLRYVGNSMQRPRP